MACALSMSDAGDLGQAPATGLDPLRTYGRRGVPVSSDHDWVAARDKTMAEGADIVPYESAGVNLQTRNRWARGPFEPNRGGAQFGGARRTATYPSPGISTRSTRF